MRGRHAFFECAIVAYRELSGDELRFSARSVRGKLAVPRSWTTPETAACACDDGGFALRFTEDDRVRQLSLGRIARDTAFCTNGIAMPESDGLRLELEPCAASVSDEASGASASSPTKPATKPASATDIEANTDSGGCGDSSGDMNDAGGCGDDSSTTAQPTRVRIRDGAAAVTALFGAGAACRSPAPKQIAVPSPAAD